MLKPLLRVAIVFGAIALAAWIVGGSSSFQFCVQQEQENPSRNTLQEYISALPVDLGIYRDCLGGFIHDSGEEIISIFTVILSTSTIFLWFATKDLVKESKRTSHQQLRAFVFGKIVPGVNMGTDEDPSAVFEHLVGHLEKYSLEVGRSAIEVAAVSV